MAIPHTLPDVRRARPRSQSFSYSPSEMQLTTRAATCVLVGRPSRRTLVPAATGRVERAAQPFRLARMIWQECEKASSASRLVRVTGMSHGIRVPPRATCMPVLEPWLANATDSHTGNKSKSTAGSCSEFVTSVEDGGTVWGSGDWFCIACAAAIHFRRFPRIPRSFAHA